MNVIPLFFFYTMLYNPLWVYRPYLGFGGRVDGRPPACKIKVFVWESYAE